MSRRRRRLAAALVTTLLLALLWRQLEPGDLVSLLRAVSGRWLLVGGSLYLALNVLRSARYRVLLPGQTSTVAGLLPLTLGVSLLGNVLPARGGEVSFVLLARSGHEVPSAESLAAVAVARLLDLVAVASWFVPLAALALPLLPATTDWPVAGVATPAVIGLVGGGLIAVAAVVLVLAAFGGRAALSARRVPALQRLADRPLAARSLTFAAAAADAFGALRRRGVLVPAFLLTLACWLATFGWLYAFTRAMGQEIGFALFAVGVTFAVLTKALPTPTLGGHGAAEAGWAVGFTLVGWPADRAIATGLAISVLNMLVVAGFGLPALAWVRARTPVG